MYMTYIHTQMGGQKLRSDFRKLTHEIQQLTMFIEKLKKHFDKMLKLTQILSEAQSFYLINVLFKVNFVYLIKILIFVLDLTNIINKISTKIFSYFTVILNFVLTFKTSSSWFPDKLPSCIVSIITAINHDIISSKTKKFLGDNLTKSDCEAVLNV